MKTSALLAAFCCVAATSGSAQSIAMDPSHLASMDTDGDGAVSSDEFFAFATFAFNKMDTNNDTTLSADEIDGYLVSDSFAQLDADGNGAVTVDEFAQQMSNDFNAADQDGDGMLN